MTDITFWGLTASPYQLKMQALADGAGVSWRRLPDQGGTFEGLRTIRRLSRAQRSHDVERYPCMEPELDEYPSVPFYTLDGKQFLYDSSGLAHHLANEFPTAHSLLPEDATLRFACQLIDEALDEFGLYMAHHNRWVTSAATNRMGEFTGREMAKALPQRLQQRIGRGLSERQVRRLPYLFSVAPHGFDAGVSPTLNPPTKHGFPPTHDILETAWKRYLAAIEGILEHQPYLLGNRFTLADASAYGQLSMNLVDGKAAQLLQELAPLTFAWLCNIRDGKHSGSEGELQLTMQLQPLLAVIAETFVPLMRQNMTAFQAATESGQRVFNEAAFDKGEALYNGELFGKPFRSVAKSFQVPVWRDICNAWGKLERSQREQITMLCPLLTNSQFSSS